MKQRPTAARGSNPAPGPGRGEAIAPCCLRPCAYFEATDPEVRGVLGAFGLCRRYPTPLSVNHAETYWCGEFKSAERASS